MANLVETSQWEVGVYQIETSDPVLGGPEGISNLQAKQLANRTLYLKALAEALGSDKQPVDGTLTALAALATAANQIIYSTGADTFALASLTAFARTLLDDVDAATALGTLGAAPLASPNFAGTPRAPTAAPGTNTDQLANTAFVQAAIAALVASSPAALDTLSELAAALGNDANFAATVTNALALKAPLASPALTGSPTAPTPAQFDNSTKLATAAFVQRALGNFRSNQTINVSTVLTVNHLGSVILFAGGGGQVFTLPLASDCVSGGAIHFRNFSSYPLTVQRQGGNMIAVGLESALTSIVLNPGETLSVFTPTDSWYAIGGSAALKHETGFGGSLGANGYQKLPSGLIVQWGIYSGIFPAGSSVTITLPIAFPNAFYTCLATLGLSANSTAGSPTAIAFSSASQFTIRNVGSGAMSDAGWLAIGR